MEIMSQSSSSLYHVVDEGVNKTTRDGKGLIVQYDIAEELHPDVREPPSCPSVRGRVPGRKRRNCRRRGGGRGQGQGGGQGGGRGGRQHRRQKRKAIIDKGTNRWPNATVYYQIADPFCKSKFYSGLGS